MTTKPGFDERETLMLRNALAAMTTVERHARRARETLQELLGIDPKLACLRDEKPDEAASEGT